MKTTGIVRAIDQLGRIVIPKELRRTLDLPDDAPMEIFTENDCIILRRYQPGCIFCGSADDITMYQKKRICEQCLKTLSATPHA